MIAVDTNLLVYAHRRDSVWHVAAADVIRRLAETAQWAIPWPCVTEFYGVVTHPRIYKPPSTIAQATQQIELWRGSSGLAILTASPSSGAAIATSRASADCAS
jgi:predicted nucleic acid-binding protein